jgi:hypothetical protein
LYKLFNTTFLQNVFCNVFELPLLRITRKRDETKKVEEKLTSKFLSIFLEKVFDMDFLQIYVYGVFELPLPSNAQKRTKRKSRKKTRLVGGWVWNLATVRGVVFFGRPLGGINSGGAGKGRQKKQNKKTDVRTYFIWPGFCFRRTTS